MSLDSASLQKLTTCFTLTFPGTNSIPYVKGYSPHGVLPSTDLNKLSFCVDPFALSAQKMPILSFFSIGSCHWDHRAKVNAPVYTKLVVPLAFSSFFPFNHQRFLINVSKRFVIITTWSYQKRACSFFVFVVIMDFFQIGFNKFLMRFSQTIYSFKAIHYKILNFQQVIVH